MAKPKDFRLQILSLARYYARDAAKDQIRGRGDKVSRYAAKEISALADQLVLSEPRFVEQARKDLAARIERQLLRTFAQNSQHLSNSGSPANQSLSMNETHAQNGVGR